MAIMGLRVPAPQILSLEAPDEDKGKRRPGTATVREVLRPKGGDSRHRQHTTLGVSCLNVLVQEGGSSRCTGTIGGSGWARGQSAGLDAVPDMSWAGVHGHSQVVRPDLSPTSSSQVCASKCAA